MIQSQCEWSTVNQNNCELFLLVHGKSVSTLVHATLESMCKNNEFTEELVYYKLVRPIYSYSLVC